THAAHPGASRRWTECSEEFEGRCCFTAGSSAARGVFGDCIGWRREPTRAGTICRHGHWVLLSDRDLCARAQERHTWDRKALWPFAGWIARAGTDSARASLQSHTLGSVLGRGVLAAFVPTVLVRLRAVVRRAK